jgi:hypothetical protein
MAEDRLRDFLYAIYIRFCNEQSSMVFEDAIRLLQSTSISDYVRESDVSTLFQRTVRDVKPGLSFPEFVVFFADMAEFVCRTAKGIRSEALLILVRAFFSVVCCSSF